MRCAGWFGGAGTTAVSGPGAGVRRDAATAVRRPPLVREVALVFGLFLVYRLGRTAITGHDDLAMTNAWWVWDVERALHLPDEELLQQWVLQWPDLLKAANWYYVGVHFPLTTAFLVWGWLRRPPAEYRYARRLLSLVTGLALVVHVVMPLAPPRMLPGLGFLDTMAVFGPSAYGESTGTIANQFAAMPSLHVGWALLIAVVVVQTARSRWRWVAVLHPVATVAVVVATANHYWVDAIAAAVLLGVAMVVVPQPYGGSLLVRWLSVRRLRRAAPLGIDAAPVAAVPAAAVPTPATAGTAPTRPAPADGVLPRPLAERLRLQLDRGDQEVAAGGPGRCPRPRSPQD